MALTQLREVLLSDVGRATPILRTLVGDVVIESKKVAGQKRPEMVAKFTIDGIPALAALERGVERQPAPIIQRSDFGST